ncbi:hypothetical protein VRU48_17820 [Pedobacter sp. KR3-3]|uniref:Lipoprotein n=1 Tax=Pedobacter albus TaxID=3113905 RepID=A0ABU7IC86_9SPHI|nr:hypothetical protein [Pedobacter sp. KR3-3]MEE1946987.1 hypothetical protein [Pedobacter sp. KR3-3]
MMSAKVYALMLLLLVGLYACSPNSTPGNSNAEAGAPMTGKAMELSSVIVDSLKKLFAIADTLQRTYNENDSVNKVDEVNEAIAITLTAILNDHKITRQNMDSLLKAPGLGIVHADDKKLWLFTWFENTGGSFKSNINMIYAKTASGQTMITSDGRVGNQEENLFPSSGAWFEKIYKLKSKKELYLCIGSGIGCNTCMFQTAVVVELLPDGINFNYEAFEPPGEEVGTYGENGPSCLTIGAANEDIEEFSFDPKTQILTIAYLTDEITPIPSGEGEKQRRIVRKLVFNGKRFVGNAFQ